MIAENSILPTGKTCADCAHFNQCDWLFSCVPENTACDWSPSRFREPPKASEPPETPEERTLREIAPQLATASDPDGDAEDRKGL